MPTSEKKIRKSLHTKIIGRKIHLFDHLPSTNDWAMARAVKGGDNGEVVIANRQSAGRGRLGRRWYSPEGGGLYFSVILKPQISPPYLSRLTLVAGAALSDSLSKLCGKQIILKWPNDLYADHRKLGGILCEAHIRGDKLHSVVIGIGINISAKLPDEIQSFAITLEELTNQKWAPEIVAASVLNSLEDWYTQFNTGKWPQIVRWCDQQNILKGKRAQINFGGETMEGLVEGLDENGYLIVTLDSGEKRIFSEGDTTIIQ